MGIGTNTRSY